MTRPCEPTIELTPIGTVESPVRTTSDAARQADEGAPPARLVIDAEFTDALDAIAVGDCIVVITWLHHADRSAHTTHPRDDTDRPPVGVFATRSPDRPNPIGLHEVAVTTLGGTTVTVDGLEAIDGTPILDIKPALGPPDQR